MAAALTVAAAYTYFLIFAQFAFLEAVRAAFGADGAMVRPLMAAMGLAGISASVLAARGLGPTNGRARLAAGFACCGLAVGCALVAEAPLFFFVAAVLTGLGAGFTTVTLAGILRAAAGVAPLGRVVGVGTGLAYGLCNLPGIFAAGVQTKAMVALGAAAVGALAGWALVPRHPPEAETDNDYTRGGVARWIAVFMALVCLDSALFYFIQHNTPLRENLWGGARQEGWNAVTHLAAAVLAGWALDRRRLGLVVFLAGATIIGAAIWLVTSHVGRVATGLGYIAAVSAYSAALVYYPARGGRPPLAAWVYAVAGWAGSALGIALTETSPQWLPTLAGMAALTLLISFGGRYFASRQPRTMNENT